MKDSNKFSLVVNDIERNVLQVALDHMEEHLESLIYSSKSTFKEELKACKDLKHIFSSLSKGLLTFYIE